MLQRIAVFALLLTAACMATGVSAQVVPSDESLTEGPATKRIGDADTTSLLSRETIAAASPSKVRGKRVDSSYVDTLGVGFFKKIMAPVYPNPERAAAMSFVVPGAGQFYNRRFAYIKVPIIYAGYAALIYGGEFNRKARNRFQTAYELKLQGLPHVYSNTRFDTPQRLRTARDGYDKNFQLSYIGIGILHLVQMLEAYTTAHLLNFDMDESLSLAPVILQLPGAGPDTDAVAGRLAVGFRYRFPSK